MKIARQYTPHVARFLRSLTPQDYDELRDSFEADPPADDLLRTTNRLLADLLAVYYTVHRDTEQHPDPYHRADFLTEPDADDEEEEAAHESDTETVVMHPAVSAPGRVTQLPLMRGHGARPGSVFDLFVANETEEDRSDEEW